MRWRRRTFGDTLEVVQVWDTRLLRSTDTTLLRVDDLRPIRRRSGPAERRTEIEYRANEVLSVTRTAARTDTLRTPLTTAEIFDAATVEVLVTALYPENSVIPVFVPAQRGVIPIEVLRRVHNGDELIYELAFPSAVVTMRLVGIRRVSQATYNFGARQLVFDLINR